VLAGECNGAGRGWFALDFRLEAAGIGPGEVRGVGGVALLPQDFSQDLPKDFPRDFPRDFDGGPWFAAARRMVGGEGIEPPTLSV
jgi:hypothetical protein